MSDDDTSRPIYAGDHVQDRDSDTAEVLVVMEHAEHVAREYQLDDETTVADLNPGYPATDPVVEAVYPVREIKRLSDLQYYAFPVSRLEVVSRVHDRDQDTVAEGVADA